MSRKAAQCLLRQLRVCPNFWLSRWPTARSSLRNITFTGRGTEDLALLPPTLAPLHCRLSKGGQPSRSQPYFSPQAMGYLCWAASTKEEWIAVALCYLSSSLFLWVSEAASISARDLRVLSMASFVSTKVGGTIVVWRPLAC